MKDLQTEKDEGGDFKEEEDIEKDERKNIPTEEAQFLEALERVGRRDQKSGIPMFCGKMNPEECMDWIEALENCFECDNIPENQRIKVEKHKMKGPTLSWWNFLQNERIEEEKNPISTWKRMLAEIKK